MASENISWRVQCERDWPRWAVTSVDSIRRSRKENFHKFINLWPDFIPEVLNLLFRAGVQ